MAQHYDDIIRENMAELLFGLAKHMLGKDIQSNTPLNVSLRETLAREPDFLQIVEVEGKKLILHIEFQSTDDKQMYYLSDNIPCTNPKTRRYRTRFRTTRALSRDKIP